MSDQTVDSRAADGQAAQPSGFGELRGVLAERTGTRPQDWYPVFKARYGMQVAFDALRESRGAGSVLTQLFTCCTAVDPIVVARLTPRYVDVDADTMSLDADKAGAMRLEPDEQVHAVMLQHTFGVIDEASAGRTAELARDMGALLVEDCAHCVARMACDGQGEPLADVSVHSFGVEKMLPTRFGGAIWVNPRLHGDDPALDAALRGRLTALPQPSKHLDTVTKLYINENRVLSRLGGLGGSLRARLTGAGWYEPPIADVERAGGLAYEPMTVTAWIAAQATAGLRGLDANENARRTVVTLYRDALRGCNGITIPGAVLDGDAQPLLRFPLFADDTAAAERIIAAARAAGGYAERWYRPELFPGVSDEAAYGLDRLDRATVTVSDRLSSTAVCLPTELSESRVHDVIAAVLQSL
ncbi:DegT/DnrJ/EryC1/StrS family aminotransferase [Bifidobacterium leontopitheci]|uniref:DegT/DnrJ/EryC1/StrS aminotransferase family protein n=1 Tax=Bifidobacterium leontopitheci TaxID=2650774 RepID=A0A6I1GID0_9BIFI|nr:DegT/DnrJ/EryC1/StrS family aminotransferase [Bifidobacterium leontopitheci]KAB7791345.1 DegT/DnrJ/EryC1/StrS aminotransferase family protein [Bifidobacterium leontopitheci]